MLFGMPKLFVFSIGLFGKSKKSQPLSEGAVGSDRAEVEGPLYWQARFFRYRGPLRLRSGQALDSSVVRIRGRPRRSG